MPIEFELLDKEPVLVGYCPKCGSTPFVPFLRGLVQRSKRFFFIGPKRPYCALICSRCKEVIGYEDIPKGDKYEI